MNSSLVRLVKSGVSTPASAKLDYHMTFISFALLGVPPTTIPPSGPGSQGNAGGSDAGAIAGGVVVVLIALAVVTVLVVALIWWW